MNDHSTEAGVLDQGSQLVVTFNAQRTLRVEGANGSTSRTLGCVEDPDMHIGDVSFTLTDPLY